MIFEKQVVATDCETAAAAPTERTVRMSMCYAFFEEEKWQSYRSRGKGLNTVYNRCYGKLVQHTSTYMYTHTRAHVYNEYSYINKSN